MDPILFHFKLILYFPSKSSNYVGTGLPGLNSTMPGLVCLAQGLNAMTLVLLKPVAPQIESSTEQLRSHRPHFQKWKGKCCVT